MYMYIYISTSFVLSNTHLLLLKTLTILVNNSMDNVLINPNISYHFFFIFMNIDIITSTINCIINKKIVDLSI